MKQEITVQQQKQSNKINRYAYTLFLCLVAYFVITGDLEDATINLGIALIFDPFDANVKWQDRPVYQRIWMIVHVSLVLAGFLYLIIR